MSDTPEMNTSAMDDTFVPRYSYEAAMSAGWALFKANYGQLLAVALIDIGITIAMGVLGQVAEQTVGFDFVTWIETIFISGPLAAGLYLFAARLARGEQLTVGAMFDGFRSYWATVKVNLVVGIGIGLCAGVFLLPGLIIGQNSSAGSALMLAGALVAVPLYVFLYMRYFYALVIVVDPLSSARTAGQALGESWRMTRGHFWSLFGLFLVLGLIAIGCLVLLVLPAFFVALPLIVGVTGVAYVQLANQSGVARVNMNTCPNCGYDVRGLPPGHCPECGAQF
jgi:uncharacterized membrane protein